MRPSRPSMRVSLSLAWLLGLIVLAGPSGCGPASPGDPSSVGPPAGMAGHETRGAGREGGSSAGIVPLAASPAPLAAPARAAVPIGVPAWRANDLDSPDVRIRLRALETWAQQPRTGAIDPLLLAVDDSDERVRAKALALLDDDWARELAAEERDGRGGR